MKKYLFWILLFLLLSSPIKAKASGLPSVINPQQLSTVETFSNSLPTYYFESNGIDLTDSTFETALYNFDGTQYPNDYTWSVKPFSEMLWRPSTNLYDSQGNLIDPEQVALATGGNRLSNTYFLYDTVSGEILNYGDSFATSVSSVNASATSTFWQKANEILSVFGPSSPNPKGAIFNQSNYNQEQIEEIINYSTASWSYGTFLSNGATYSYGFFTPSVDQPGTMVAKKDWRGFVIYYFNDGAAYDWYCTEGNSTLNRSGMGVGTGTFNYNGYTYSYVFPKNQFYDTSRLTTNGRGTVGSKPNYAVSYYTPSETYDTVETVNMTKFLENPVAKSTIQNPNFDRNASLSYENFPLYTSTAAPSYSPTYDYYYDYYITEYTPSIGDDIDTLNPDEITDGIPILNNLSKRFPFSIPWDIYSIVSGLSAERETPYIDTVLTIPVINYDWHIQYDLSAFDDVASLFRTLFLISFVIGLAYFSYDHFFGS